MLSNNSRVYPADDTAASTAASFAPTDTNNKVVRDTNSQIARTTRKDRPRPSSPPSTDIDLQQQKSDITFETLQDHTRGPLPLAKSLPLSRIRYTPSFLGKQYQALELTLDDISSGVFVLKSSTLKVERITNFDSGGLGKLVLDERGLLQLIRLAFY